MFPAHVGSVFYQKYHEAMREQKTMEFEARSPVTDRWIEGHIYPSEESLSVYHRDITERKRVEEKLRRSEAYLAEGQRISHTGSWAVRFPSEDVFWTQEVYRIYGLDPATTKLSQQMAFQLIHPEDRPFVKEAFERALREKSDYAVEHRAILPGGSIKHLHALGHPVLNESGTLTEYVGTVMDITERKRAEKLLRKAHKRVEMILDSITDQFFALSEDWQFTYLNKHAAEQMKILGKDPARLIGKVLWEEFPYVPNEEALRRVMSERVAITDQLYYPPLGEWVENHMYPSPDGGLVTFQKYITERKQAEEELRRSETLLAEAQRLSHTGSWALNVSSGELFWSKEHFRIVGLDPEEVKPSYPMALQYIHPEDRAFVQQTFDRVFRERSIFELDCRVVRPDGTVRHIHSLAHPMFNESGDLTEYVGTIIDTTERKLAEEALKKAFAEIKTLKDQLAQEKLYLEEEIRSERGFEEIIGESVELKRILKQVETVAPTDSTVLIEGETGTGKELIARAIHNLSSRRERTFVKINCAAIPMGLLEAELFGHEKGAFTGAIAQRVGRFELANRGTVFLDEIGEIPLELQAKLLRVLQEQEFERLGSTRTLRVDVRVIAASNRDLAKMVSERAFRSDLYYRLKVFPIMIPALRERVEDIPTLVRYFTQRYARKLRKAITSIGSETMSALCRYPWPGNIRELENFVERSVILSRGSMLEAPLGELAPVHRRKADMSTLKDLQREHILRALNESNWVIGGRFGAAAKLGMKRTSLQYRMQKLGISRPR
jgi:PAS domain S-box-containing protein